MKMQVDVNGVELKIGDTVRVVDETGSYASFRGTKGQLGTVVKNNPDLNTTKVKLQSGVEGSMYGYRFEKVETKVSRIGKQYQYGKPTITGTTYTVVYENEYGVLVTWPTSNNDHAWISNTELKNYIEIIPEEWVVLYRSGNKVMISDSRFDSEAKALTYGRDVFSSTFIQAVKLQK